MRVIHAYISSEILKHAAVVLSAVMGIYGCVDFFERLDNFMEAGLPVSRLMVYLMYKTPLILTQVTPAAVLLSVLITFGLMARAHEIIALKSGGVSIYRLAQPVSLLCACFGIGLFLFSEIIVPLASGKANRIYLEEVKKRSAVISREKNIWMKDGRTILFISYYNKAARSVYGVTLYSFDENFRLVQRVDAEKGVYVNTGWVLHTIMRQNLNPETDTYTVRFETESPEPIHLTPEGFETVVKKSEEMSFLELLDYVNKVEKEGYDATHYRVDLHAKIAFPSVCLILGVIGIGIAVRTRDGLAVSVAAGISLTFLYWIFHSFCVSLGYGGVLPPFVAAWTANLFFSCAAVLLILYAD